MSGRWEQGYWPRTMKQVRDVDFLSDLPDAIIHLIFSFLTTKDAVRASSLSRAWRNRWKSSPFLCFSHSEFNSCKSFNLFASAVLLDRDPVDLQSFKFFGDKDGATSRVAYKWIKHALRHKVKELVLDLHNTAFSGIPLSVFSNKALEFLCLIARYSGCINLSLPVPDAALYRLRVLHVMRFDLRSVEFDKMLTGCPVLEELLLEDCRLKKPRISMPKLKCLKFIHCVLCDGVVIASNPNLQKLVIYYDFSFSLGNFAVIIDKLPSLVDAVLCLDRCDRISFEGDGLLNVKWLQILLPEVKESLKSIINWISSSRLHNLKYAELLTPLNKKYIKAVKQAIACMPNLENLEIRENLPIVRARSGLEPEKVVSEHFALPKHLHSVKIIPLEPLEVFMDFLSNSVHLKRTDKEELEKYVPL